MRYENNLRFIKAPTDLHFVHTMLDDALASDFKFLALDTEGEGPARLLQCATKQWAIVLDLAKMRGSTQLSNAVKRLFDHNIGLSRLGRHS